MSTYTTYKLKATPTVNRPKIVYPNVLRTGKLVRYTGTPVYILPECCVGVWGGGIGDIRKPQQKNNKHTNTYTTTIKTYNKPIQTYRENGQHAQRSEIHRNSIGWS